MLAFSREGGGERLLCIFNMSERATTVTVPFATRGSGAPGNASGPAGGKLALGPFEGYIGIA